MLEAWDKTGNGRQAGCLHLPIEEGPTWRVRERRNLRLTPAQDTVLRRAAEAHGDPVSDYVLRHAVEAAEADLAGRRVFVVDDAAWYELEQLLDRPRRPRPSSAA